MPARGGLALPVSAPEAQGADGLPQAWIVAAKDEGRWRSSIA